MKYYLVSACLLGIKSRYDGGSSLNHSLAATLRGKPVLIICPEKLGLLKTPRLPAQITPIDFKSRNTGELDGHDVLRGRAGVRSKTRSVTGQFIKGAFRAGQLLEYVGITKSYLKSRSPSCGYGRVYFRGSKNPNTARLIKGDGVFAALLREKGIKATSL
ncbi:MAG: DUF523 domain-containing protein [Candidatus Brocadiia bacterium]